MITTLTEFDAKFQEGEYEYDALLQYHTDEAALQEEINKIDLTSAHQVLADTYNISVTDERVREIMRENIWVACAVMTGEIFDEALMEDFYILTIAE